MIRCELFRRSATSVAVALLSAASAGERVVAQEALISGHDIALTAAALAGTVALSRYDQRITRTFNNSGFHTRHPGFRTAANRASIVTETVLMGSGSLVYVVASARRDWATADVGLHTTESVASAAMFI